MTSRYKISVFCGSSSGKSEEYALAASSLGRVLARERIWLNYGGGATGMMGALANSCLSAGGDITGVLPLEVQEQESPHPEVTDIRWVTTIEARKEALVELADAIIVLPGGLGTIEELLFVLARGRMGLHDKPYGILNIRNFYSHILEFFNHGTCEGFIKEKHLSTIIIKSDPIALVNALTARPKRKNTGPA